MWKQQKVRLVGVGKLIQHNGQLADPTNEGVKALKKISGKRSKTDADFEEMARLEFQGSLYYGENGPVVPGRMLESCIVGGAKKTREGKVATSAIFIDDNPDLIYDGPKDRESLWANEDFRLVVPVVISRARIMRTRPIFTDWQVEFTFNYDDEQTNKAAVLKWLEVAGQQVGLGDWRPKYGRFAVEAD